MKQLRFVPRQWKWPGGERVALTVGVPFEAFERRSQYAQSNKGDKPDHFSISYGDYGWKAGVWRLLELLDEFGLKGSMSANGLAAERHPEVLKIAAGEGWDFVGHGWANDHEASDSNPEAELAEIRRCTAALTAAAGVRPLGWVSPGNAGSANTADMLKQEGYIWHGDDASDDLPFVMQTKHGPLVVMPKTNIPHNDLIMWAVSRNSPEVMWDNFKDTFDQLYDEGGRGRPGWIELTLHSHMGGRPTLVPMLRRCLQYARDHDAVWFTRKCDVADWALQQDAALPATAGR